MYCVFIFFSGVDGPRDVRLSLPNKETTKGTDGDYMDGVDDDDDGTMPYVELGLIMIDKYLFELWVYKGNAESIRII